MNKNNVNDNFVKQYLEIYKNEGLKKKTNNLKSNNKYGTNKNQNIQSTSPESYLPDEIILKIFKHLSPSDLMVCNSVCKKWNILSEKNELWKYFVKSFYPQIKTQNLNSIKKEILNSQGIFQISKQDLYKLKQKDRFSFLPSYIKDFLLKSINIKLAIILLDGHCRELFPYFINDSSSSTASMSLSFIWKDANMIEQLNNVGNNIVFKIYAIFPIFKSNKNCNQGPYHRILLYNYDNKMDKMNTVICENQSLKLNLLSQVDDEFNLYAGLWIQGNGIAYIIAQLQLHWLFNKIKFLRTLQSSKPIPNSSELDPTYGLHDYLISIELSNKKESIWKEQFQHLHQHESTDTNVPINYKRFWMIKPDNSNSRYSFKNKIEFYWKTNCFSGTMNDTCLIDVLILDEFLNPFWTYSQFNSVEKEPKRLERMDFDSDRIKCLHVKTSQVELQLGFLWDECEETNFMISLFCDIHVGYINQYFGTKYTN